MLPNPCGAWGLRWAMDELLGEGCGLPELLLSCECVGMEVVSGAGHPCGGWQPVPITLLCLPSMGEYVEQSQLAEASPSVPCTQMPLLSHFFTAASPTISIKIFGRGR